MIILGTVVHGLLESLDLGLIQQWQQILVVSITTHTAGCSGSTWSSSSSSHPTHIALGQHLLQREDIPRPRRDGMGEQLPETRAMSMGCCHGDGAEATLLRGSSKAQGILLLCGHEGIGPVGQQQGHDLQVTRSGSQLQGRQGTLLLAAPCTALDLATSLQQNPEGHVVGPAGSEAQRRPVLSVRLDCRMSRAPGRWHLYIRIAAGVQERMQGHLVVPDAGNHQGGQSGAVLGVVAGRGGSSWAAWASSSARPVRRS